ncbi:molybdopterin-dependent oxidoreductase [Piscinibacter koreensis]|uniref:Molybdopterin-dependent oxidoreductase n=1 Tax=Piscinibacter koreensis TaxID=2742824 RepID=A0A7Y6NTN3_9BURK|nr:molybdopterin-dependent oxidoreductase [Schlegelella koreensis]NUZ09089.1 molybdopterin-dependent oxidoreductase [Schlegelella koreensis]
MHKRRFMSVAIVGAAGLGSLPSLAASRTAARSQPGPTLLTVSGAIGAGNRGPFDPVLDQLMGKQKLGFVRAQTFDFAAITALPSVLIRPTLEYDAKPHELSGPLLMDVIRACGVRASEKTALFVRAIDGYAAHLSAADAERRRYIVATHLDGRPMALGGLGPLWTIYDADRHPDMAAKPLPDRFGSCPWATYHIDVKEA